MHTYLNPLFLAASMQGNCGSCWAHAGVSAIEAKLLIQDGLTNETSVSLSMQQIVSCPWWMYMCPVQKTGDQCSVADVHSGHCSQVSCDLFTAKPAGGCTGGYPETVRLL